MESQKFSTSDPKDCLARNVSEQRKRTPQWIFITFIVLASLGFIDATYLVVTHYMGIDLYCAVLEGCNTVTRSPYANMFGIYLGVYGVLYYLAILILTILHLDLKNKKILKLLMPLPILGFLFSLWLVYLQLFVIHAICIYCMLSATTSTLLFIVNFFLISSFFSGKTENK